jgi:hypothetical protein
MNSDDYSDGSAYAGPRRIDHQADGLPDCLAGGSLLRHLEVLL